MKAVLNEHGACFEIALEPETMDEAATIVRMGMNGTKDMHSVSASVYADKTVRGYLLFGQRKNSVSDVAPGKS